MQELSEFSKFTWNPDASYCVIAAGGFEERAVRGVELLKESSVRISVGIVVEFRDQHIPEHVKNQHRLVNTLRGSAEGVDIHEVQAERVEFIEQLLTSLDVETRIIVDVSSMPSATILRILRAVRNTRRMPLILFTEAEDYYPKREQAEKYLHFEDDELAFDVASTQENEHIMYAGLASIGTVPGFEGRISPTAPTSIILFPTYKRTRISSILSELEVMRRVFFLSKPVREDLNWRERAMRIINYDLIDYDTDYVQSVSTLSPTETFQALCSLFELGILTPRGNTIVCPHGSKMQTVGVWLFCERNPEVRVVLSHPTQFFHKKYSVGYLNSFIFDPMLCRPESAT